MMKSERGRASGYGRLSSSSEEMEPEPPLFVVSI